MSTYEGFFINLRDSRERAEALSRHLAEHGLVGRYQRVDAVDGATVTAYHATKLKAGALGCWLSHENIIKSHRSGARHIHVIEDDIILAADTDDKFDVGLDRRKDIRCAPALANATKQDRLLPTGRKHFVAREVFSPR